MNIIFLIIHTVVGLLRFSLSANRLVYQISDRLLIVKYCSIYIILNKNMFNIYFFILNENGNTFNVRVLNYFYLTTCLDF